MAPPIQYTSPAWWLEDTASDDASVTSTSFSPGSTVREQEQLQHPSGFNTYHSSFRTQDSLASYPHFPNTTPYSAPVDQANFDVGGECHSSAFLESDISLCSYGFDPAYTSLYPIPDGFPQTSSGLEHGSSLVSTGDPAMINVRQTSDPIPGYFMSSTFALPQTPYIASPRHHTLHLGQDTEERFQTDAYASYFTDIPPGDGDTAQLAARLAVENCFIFNFANPAPGTNTSSYLGENVEAVGFEAAQAPRYTASPPSEKQLIPSEEPVGHCGWEVANGILCREVLTIASLSGHLSKHGIRNMSRDHATKCNWVGCKRTKTMNRESMLRHVREVHLSLRRSSKRMQEPYV